MKGESDERRKNCEEEGTKKEGTQGGRDERRKGCKEEGMKLIKDDRQMN